MERRGLQTWLGRRNEKRDRDTLFWGRRGDRLNGKRFETKLSRRRGGRIGDLSCLSLFTLERKLPVFLRRHEQDVSPLLHYFWLVQVFVILYHVCTKLIVL